MSDPVQKPENEPLRQWYGRTVRRPRKAILYATILSAIAMYFAWNNMSIGSLSRLQTFNGAAVVPALAILWTSALVFMFLKPTREAAFRSQETLDAGLKTLDGKMSIATKALETRLDSVTTMVSDALHTRIIPAMDTWNRVGQRLEDVIVNKKVFEEITRVLSEVSAGTKSMEKHATEVKPTILALKGIQQKLDRCFDEDFVDDLKDAVAGMRDFAGRPVSRVQKPMLPMLAQAPAPVPAPTQEPVAEAPAPVEAPATEITSAAPTSEPAPFPAIGAVGNPRVIEKIRPIPAAPEPENSPAPERDFSLARRIISSKKKVKTP